MQSEVFVSFLQRIIINILFTFLIAYDIIHLADFGADIKVV